jgi:alanyl-tRNA synthetase
VEGSDAQGLKALATGITARPGHVAILLSAATPPLVVIARAPDVALDAGAILRALTTRFGGKGGGRPELAQGGGFTATPQELLDAVRTMLAQP